MTAQPDPPLNEDMPSWWAALMLRACDASLPDTDLVACLRYLDKLRRERDRLLTQFTELRAVREAPSLTLLNRVEAVLDYLNDRINAEATVVPIAEVTGRLSGRVS